MKKKIWIFAIIFFVILGMMGYKLFRKDITGNRTDAFETDTPVFKAWEFSLPDTEGRLVSLKDFAGKVVLLTFWTSRCPYCIREIPILKKIYEKYNQQDVEIVTVIIGEGRESVNRIKEREKIPYLILLDKYHEVSRLYKVIGVPTDIIIDRKSNIKYYGYFWPDNLEEIINGLL
ncbi:MAG: peroxiredoxin family protein [Candidatus Omnitrophota bacterium]